MFELLKVFLLQVLEIIQRRHVWINSDSKHIPQYNK
jgi:hypothetical protein